MTPDALRRSTPCRPAAGSRKGANRASRYSMLRPLTSASAPPKRSATSLNRALSSASAQVSKGESVNSIRVPSTSKNKHHSSEGGGVCVIRQSLQDGGAELRDARIRRVTFTRKSSSKIETEPPNFGNLLAMFRSVMLRFVLPVAFASCVVAYFGLPYIERL